ncbi:MAG: hypothetical protein JNJ49_10045 [Bdellovibrionaceae bacterium]|nr:hypothetical protein [Pseudobdellovibrionaceae bacterium]
MKTFILALALSFSPTLMAAGPATKAGYALKMELSMNGKVVSTPQLIVRNGATGSITEESATQKTFIEVTATEGSVQKRQGIMMNFVVGVIAKDGVRTVLSRPSILANENEKAEITIAGKESGETMALSVIAARKTL